MTHFNPILAEKLDDDKNELIFRDPKSKPEKKPAFYIFIVFISILVALSFVIPIYSLINNSKTEKSKEKSKSVISNDKPSRDQLTNRI